jgi:Skp family chaperone for outer membrane proteins
VHHFGPYRDFARICILGLALCLFLGADVSGEVKGPLEEIRLGVADVERILAEYWRTRRVKAELEQYRTSEEVRAKQRELDSLERETVGRRFTFFQRNEPSEDVLRLRAELQALMEKEAQRSREREKEALEGLLSDIQRSADAIGQRQQLSIIFDSNTPHVLYVDRGKDGIDDVTNMIIQDLNF